MLLLNRNWTACEGIAVEEWRANGTQVASRKSSIHTKETCDERQDFQVSKLQEHK